MTSTSTNTVAVSPAEPGAEPGAGDGELAGEEAERGKPEQREHAGGEAAGDQRCAGGQRRGPRRSGWCRAACRMCPARQEQDGLGQAVAEHVQQHRGDGQGPADGGAERQQAHVLDAGVGQHPFVVALRDQQRVAATSREASAITGSRVRAKPVPSATSAMALTRRMA